MNTIKRKEYCKEYAKRWRENNPEYLKEWRENNHEEYNLYCRENMRKRREFLKCTKKAKEVTGVNLSNIETKELSKFKDSILLRILKAVCETYDVDINVVKGKRRFQNLITVRREYCYLAWKLTRQTDKNPHGNSLSVIGAEIGKDHATVLHHKDKVLGWLKIHSYGLVEKLEMIEAKL